MFSSKPQRYLVLSDSHGASDRIDTLLRRNQAYADGVIFLGDGLTDLLQVKEAYPQLAYFTISGNCDSSYAALLTHAEPELILTLSGTKILLTHGHLFGVKGSDLALSKQADACNAAVVLHGHTHIPRAERKITPGGRTVLFGNPGSLGNSFSPKFGVLEFVGGQPLFELFDYTV